MINAKERHVIRTFGRTIGIDQANLGVTHQPLLRQFWRHGLAGGQHPAQAVQFNRGIRQHALNQRRHAFQHADALDIDLRQQGLRVVGDGVRNDLDPRTEQGCCEELPHRNIEALRSSLRDHIRLAQLQVRHFAQLVVEHATLLDHHAFGQPGGTRGVDDVGEVVRAAVDLRVVIRPLPGLHVFPYQ